MKKIISAIAIIFCVTFFAQESKAQGNLQFNQVLLIEIAASGTYTINVPAGKVWKIESGGSYSGSNTGIILRNAAVQPIAQFSNSSTIATSCYPFWLPSGFSGSFLNGTAGGRISISIIEFNVVP
jgi:hypothetical protein